MAIRNFVAQIGEQVLDLARELLDTERARPMRQSAGGDVVASGRAADPEIDPPRIEGFEHTELLGDFERAVMREHDAAGADAHGRGRGREPPGQNLGGGAGKSFRGMMFGDPITVIAPALASARELNRFGNRLRRGTAGADG